MKHLTINNYNEAELLAIPVPAKTLSYSPISHGEIIEGIKEQLDIKGFKIKTTNYHANHEGTKLIGYYGIEHTDSELGIMIAFRNSYNKTMSAGLAIGGQVWICSNGIVSGDISLIRKHTGAAISVVKNKIIDSINEFDISFNSIIADRNLMKERDITKKTCSELLGRMYIEEKMITSTQLDIIKNELYYSKDFTNDTVWDFYNNITESLKTSTLNNYLGDHVKVHNFIKKELLTLKTLA
jgi:hypothetical protein